MITAMITRNRDLLGLGQEVELTSQGLSVFRSRQWSEDLMRLTHTHVELEINLAQEGAVTYLHGGTPLTIPNRRLCAFWGVKPHVLIGCQEPLDFFSVHVPLSSFTRWDLPGHFRKAVLGGAVWIDSNPEHAPSDFLTMERWMADLASPREDIRQIVLLEAEARIRRLALTPNLLKTTKTQGVALGSTNHGMEKVEKMTSFIAANYREPIGAEEIAAAAGLNANYATTLFRSICGTTLLQYLNNQRLSHAQMLLHTSSASIMEIALLSGFGSISAFNRAFKKAYAQAPSQYRRLCHTQN